MASWICPGQHNRPPESTIKQIVQIFQQSVSKEGQTTKKYNKKFIWFVQMSINKHSQFRPSKITTRRIVRKVLSQKTYKVHIT